VLILLPFATEHLLTGPGTTSHYLLAVLLPLLGAVPLWLHLAGRVDRLRLWAAASGLTAAAFAGLLFVQPGPGAALPALALCVGIGIGMGGGDLLAATLLADVIDADELGTGERREGAYAAAWNLSRKLAAALAAGGAGLLLQASGLEGAPEGEAEAGTLLLLRMGTAGLPALLFALASLILLAWRFDGRARAALREELARRRAERE